MCQYHTFTAYLVLNKFMGVSCVDFYKANSRGNVMSNLFLRTF
jgi:hypothetical protein